MVLVTLLNPSTHTTHRHTKLYTDTYAYPFTGLLPASSPPHPGSLPGVARHSIDSPKWDQTGSDSEVRVIPSREGKQVEGEAGTCCWR